MADKLRTLIIELDVKHTGVDEEEILDVMYQALELKYGKWFVSTIDTIEIDEE